MQQMGSHAYKQTEKPSLKKSRSLVFFLTEHLSVCWSVNRFFHSSMSVLLLQGRVYAGIQLEVLFTTISLAVSDNSFKILPPCTSLVNKVKCIFVLVLQGCILFMRALLKAPYIRSYYRVSIHSNIVYPWNIMTIAVCCGILNLNMKMSQCSGSSALAQL